MQDVSAPARPTFEGVRLMATERSRRRFFEDVGRGTLIAVLGTSSAIELGLAPRSLAEELDGALTFGELEPLVCALQETPIGKLQSDLVSRLRGGTELKTLVAAAALANARTFGGEDYIGFHTFMALAPALRMAKLMPTGAEALPVMKVLYRNTDRIHDVGGRGAEVLREVHPAATAVPSGDDSLYQAIRGRDAKHAEQMMASYVASDPLSALNALLPSVRDNPEVHRVVLPYRAWEMQEIVGGEHALTLLRQSLRYCVRAEPQRRTEISAHETLLVGLLDEYKLYATQPGTRQAEDRFVHHLADTFAQASPQDAGRAAARPQAHGFDPAVIGEAISLAAAKLVLRDGGRLPQWEDRLKTAGSVHGDSVGVHAADSANAWRNLARVSTGRNVFACLIIGAWQVARDREQSPNLLRDSLPSKYQLDAVRTDDADSLLAMLDEAIGDNLQGKATAIVHRYGELSMPAERVFKTLARYAISEDGALHAEKYFQTVWDDFHATRPSVRWLHLVALARVTASEYGTPAAGQAEARELLGLV
jgi:hypothetical protein